MPRNKDIKKVLVIGSGPIVIGQAAEFDYAGTQACRSLKEEGMEVVLLNSNPATIMTDKDIADRVYIEPLTVEVVEQLILKEKPDSVLPTLGGQAGLNLAMELEEKGFLVFGQRVFQRHMMHGMILSERSIGCHKNKRIFAIFIFYQMQKDPLRYMQLLVLLCEIQFHTAFIA